MSNFRKSYFLLLYICVTCSSIVQAANNITSSYMMLDEEQLLKGRFINGHSRKPRFLSFQTTDDDISVELQLSVPFLSIPIKKTIDGASGLMNKFSGVNVNLAAVGLAGAVVFGSAYILPSVIKLLSVKHVGNARDIDGKENDWVTHLEKELTVRGAPPRACTGRILCWLTQKSNNGFAVGEPNSYDKIINGITSNDWILKMLKNTIFQEAIVFGYNKQDCSVIYSDCKLNETSLQNMMKRISHMFNMNI